MILADHATKARTIGLIPFAADCAGPDIGPILLIHRHVDGVITFHHKPAEGTFQNLFGIRAQYLAGMFPEFQRRLEHDSYYSINAYWYPEQNRHYLPAAWVRKPERLKYLCAAYCDLDIYRHNLSIGQALATIADYQDDGVLPPASVLVRSGRGIWAIWLLCDPKHPDQPQPAFPDKLMLYARVQRAIGERLATVGADAAARDALRLTRVPGSTHSLAGQRVRYWFQADESGSAYVYTLPELADWFHVDQRRDRRIERIVSRDNETQRRGWKALNARRLRDLEMLRAMRGAFHEGCRNHAAIIYAFLLARNGVNAEDAADMMRAFAAECIPPLSAAECRSAVGWGFSRRMVRFRDETIADRLQVTPEEAAMLEGLPPAGCYARRGESASIDRAARHAFIREIIAENGGRVFSSRRLAAMLGDRGVVVSHPTVSGDLHTLGLISRTNQPKLELTDSGSYRENCDLNEVLKHPLKMPCI